MNLRSLDHLVLTVADIEATVRFYEQVLGMEHRVSSEERHALHFGSQKINLHQKDHTFEPKAGSPTPGSADLCFLTDLSIERFLSHLKQNNLEPLDGPVSRQGARSRLISVYVRDPDGNLVEISNEVE
jgi:catechol 2,3-dioxygenase-like lactoylglutathione lyase family enzyme